MARKARYIAFEGIDGSGKTKQLTLLKEALEEKGFSVLVTREFGSPHNFACERIRDFALNSTHDIDELAGQFMFAACSSQHNEKVIKPALSEYDFVLSDRSIESNLAYCVGIGIDRDLARALHFLDERKEHPDTIVYLNIDPQTSWSRVGKRSKEQFTDGGEDRIEAKGVRFQEQVREEYGRRLEESSYYVTVDSQNSIEDTHQLVLDKLFPEGIKNDKTY